MTKTNKLTRLGPIITFDGSKTFSLRNVRSLDHYGVSVQVNFDAGEPIIFRAQNFDDALNFFMALTDHWASWEMGN